MSFKTMTACSLVGILMVATVNAIAGEKTYNFTTIDYPNAVSTNIVGGISDRGDIVGSYTDSANKTHGFLLSGGVFTTIGIPGAAVTNARGINARGDIVGTYQITPSLPGGDFHGFLLRDGVFTTVDYPGHLNTIVQRISATGVILGCYHDQDTMGTMHGMMLTGEGLSALRAEASIQNFNVFLEIQRLQGFSALGVEASMHNGSSPEGTRLAGLYTDMMTGKTHGYAIEKGVFVPFDVPGSIATAAWDMNPSGEIVGSYTDAENRVRGFLRDGDEYLSIDFPGSISTRAFGINTRGDIVGAYMDASRRLHGFLAEVVRKP